MSTIPLKRILYCNGIPVFYWMQKEVKQIEAMEKLQHVVIEWMARHGGIKEDYPGAMWNQRVQVEIFEEEQVKVRNKELEVVLERMNGDMMSCNEELIPSKSLMYENAHAIVQVPHAQQTLNFNSISPTKKLHDLVTHNIKEVVVHVHSDE
ncbi:hypothetical protein K7X08_028944 [Anisodus acutangulus]|uniref:Uncharacterized protein n=1 Tax=Anisodus acutangulus TaxID=402998 RepID=A0A9Q1L1F1_9SOLA|nr:hypothetical protein K7X08_028944 [Anisodus acutangulus]